MVRSLALLFLRSIRVLFCILSTNMAKSAMPMLMTIRFIVASLLIIVMLIVNLWSIVYVTFENGCKA